MPDEIIDVNNKETDEKKLREERKANGRYASVIIALVLILLAIYHAWIRKTPVLAGILVPALIMTMYGGWVVYLTRRDKKRRIYLERQMEEEARRELTSLKLLNKDSTNDLITEKNFYFDTSTSNSPEETPLKHNKQHHHHHHRKHHHHHHHHRRHHKSEHEINSDLKSKYQDYQNPNILVVESCNDQIISKHHKKRRDRRRKSNTSEKSINLQNINSTENLANEGIIKKPSFRQKIFQHKPYREALLVKSDLKYLELPPFLHRTNSAP